MKKSLLAAIFFLSSTLAQSTGLSPYYCTFVAHEGVWYEDLSWRGFSNYMIQPGWNQTSSISKAVSAGRPEGDEFGMCSNLSFMRPEDGALTFYWVTGKNLKSLGESCMYAGDQVRFKRHAIKLQNNDSYIHGRNKAMIRGEEFEFLNIAGVRPSPSGDPHELCLRAFGDIVGVRPLQEAAFDLPIKFLDQ
jgi:hypothetical protein